MQHLLRAYSCYFGDITGIMDAATVEAVKAYQTAHGLDTDGEVGKNTWSKLLTI